MRGNGCSYTCSTGQGGNKWFIISLSRIAVREWWVETHDTAPTAIPLGETVSRGPVVETHDTGRDK